MPVGLIVGRERPLDRVPVQTSLHVRVVGDVNRVVVVDERVMIYRIVEREGRGHQQKTQDPCPRLDPMQPPMVGPVPSPHRRCQTNRSHSCSLISRIISDQLFEELVMPGLGCKIPTTSPVPTRRSYRRVAGFPPRRNIPERAPYLRGRYRHGPCYSTRRTLSWRRARNSGPSYIAQWPPSGSRAVARRYRYSCC